MSTDTDPRIERHTKLLELLLAQSETYHNHKETMAHAGVLLQIALIAGMVSVEHWPPPWVPDVHVSARVIIAVAFVALWLLIHVFVRWQLRNKRSAALTNAAFLRTLRKWATTPPTDDDLKAYQVKNSQKLRVRTLLDEYFIPLPSATLHYDVDKAGYPSGMVQEWIDQEGNLGTGAVRAEWLLWIGSILILAIGLFRTLS